MIRIRGSVTYEGGSVATFEAGPPMLVEWELYALRHGYPAKLDEAPQMLSMLVIAHAALGVAEGFEVWRKSLADVEVEVEGVPPTLPEPSFAQ